MESSVMLNHEEDMVEFQRKTLSKLMVNSAVVIRVHPQLNVLLAWDVIRGLFVSILQQVALLVLPVIPIIKQDKIKVLMDRLSVLNNAPITLTVDLGYSAIQITKFVRMSQLEPDLVLIVIFTVSQENRSKLTMELDF
jgi:hypothetical protein